MNKKSAYVIGIHESRLRKKLVQYFKSHGQQVRAARHGKEVLTLINDVNPIMILLDLYLTEPSGLEVLRQLRSQGHEEKVIVLAGDSMRTLSSEAFQLGALQINGRPFSLNQVIGAMRVASGELDQDPVTEMASQIETGSFV